MELWKESALYPLDATSSRPYLFLPCLVLISIDRYIAVKKPLRYRDIVTTRRVICGVLSAWGFTIYVTIQESILAAVNRASDIYNVYNNVSFSMLTTVG